MVKQKETFGRVSFDFPFPEHFFKIECVSWQLGTIRPVILDFWGSKKPSTSAYGTGRWLLNSMAMLQPISCRIFRIFIRIRCWALSMDLGGLSRIFAISV